jgi:hypothetical protein
MSRSSVCRPDAITSSSLLPIREIVAFDSYVAGLDSLLSLFQAMPSGLCRNDPARRTMAQTIDEYIGRLGGELRIAAFAPGFKHGALSRRHNDSCRLSDAAQTSLNHDSFFTDGGCQVPWAGIKAVKPQENSVPNLEFVTSSIRVATRFAGSES